MREDIPRIVGNQVRSQAQLTISAVDFCCNFVSSARNSGPLAASNHGSWCAAFGFGGRLPCGAQPRLVYC